MEYTLEELEKAADYLIQHYLKSHDIWCFYGEMGAGKTTLIKEICRQLGVQEGMSSPSFGIVNEYLTEQNSEIFHFDFYRIKNTAEAEDLGIYDYFFSGNLCLVEWPELVDEILPEDVLKINIILVEENRRLLKIAADE
jgi:tRNA threonylcarbamoyladenosine biosynthesis protein TsaE